MGLDLALLTFEADFEYLQFSHTVLDCDRDSGLFDIIRSVEKVCGEPVNEGFTSHLGRNASGEMCYGYTTETPYAEPVKYVMAHRLKLFGQRPETQACPKNRAVWAYLNCLPSDTKIALYWH